MYHVRNFTIHVKEQLKEVLFTIMVNRDIFEKQNTFSMYITTTDECVPKHLKNPSPQADNETDDAPSDHVQASIGTVITIANIGPYLNEIYKREQYVTCFLFQTTLCHIQNSWFLGLGYNFGYFWRFIKFHQNENHQI